MYTAPDRLTPKATIGSNVMSDEAAVLKGRASALFSRLAPDYDRGGQGCFAHFGRRLVDAVGIAPGQRVLDVACGRGAALFPAAERVGAGGAAVGVDLAEGMIQATREQAIERGLALDLRVMDAEHLDFPDATFDRVLCGFGLMFFPDVARALGEFRRVLAPGGRLGVSTWRVTEAQDLVIVLMRLGFTNPAGAAILRFKDPDALAHALTEAGFSDVEARIDTHTFRYADLDDYWQTARGTGMRAWLDTFAAAQTAQVRAALADHLRPNQREDGLYVEASAVLATASR